MAGKTNMCIFYGLLILVLVVSVNGSPNFGRNRLRSGRGLFNSFDYNNNGFFEYDEMRVIGERFLPGGFEVDYETMREEIDFNRNGRVEIDEFTEYMRDFYPNIFSGFF